MPSSILTAQEIRVLERTVPADVQVRLLAVARSRFDGKLFPVRGEHTVEGGFRCHFNRFYLWFNDANGSTHTVHEDIPTHPQILEEQQ